MTTSQTIRVDYVTSFASLVVTPQNLTWVILHLKKKKKFDDTTQKKRARNGVVLKHTSDLILKVDRLMNERKILRSNIRHYPKRLFNEGLTRPSIITKRSGIYLQS